MTTDDVLCPELDLLQRVFCHRRRVADQPNVASRSRAIGLFVELVNRNTLELLPSRLGGREVAPQTGIPQLLDSSRQPLRPATARR